MKINILNVVLLRKRCYNKAIINKRDDTHMEPVRLLEALAVAEKLKDATRHCRRAFMENHIDGIFCQR